MIYPDLIKVLIVTSPPGFKYLSQQLLTETNIEVDLARLSDIESVIDVNDIRMWCRGIPLSNYDYVWIQTIGNTKDIAYMLALYLKQNNILHSQTEIETNKLLDVFSLAFNNISLPKTYFCSTSNLQYNLERIENELSYPFVIKTTIGFGGNDVHLVNNREEFFALLPYLKTFRKYICQKYIPNQFDYRIIIGNGKILSGEKRIRISDSFRNNACLGAKEIFLNIQDIPSEIKSLALDSYSTIGLKWVGVDIVTDEISGKNYILEVNRCPDLTKDSTEILAAKTFIDVIKKQVIAQKRIKRLIGLEYHNNGIPNPKHSESILKDSIV